MELQTLFKLLIVYSEGIWCLPPEILAFSLTQWLGLGTFLCINEWLLFFLTSIHAPLLPMPSINSPKPSNHPRSWMWECTPRFSHSSGKERKWCEFKGNLNYTVTPRQAWTITRPCHNSKPHQTLWSHCGAPCIVSPCSAITLTWLHRN